MKKLIVIVALALAATSSYAADEGCRCQAQLHGISGSVAYNAQLNVVAPSIRAAQQELRSIPFGDKVRGQVVCQQGKQRVGFSFINQRGGQYAQTEAYPIAAEKTAGVGAAKKGVANGHAM